MIILVGVLYFYLLPYSRSEDLSPVSDTVTEEAGRVVNAVRDTTYDMVTTAKVKTALAISKTVQAFDIDVDSRDGVVSLVGTVLSVEVEAAALEIASARDRIRCVGCDGSHRPARHQRRGRNRPRCCIVRNRLADAEMKALVYEDSFVPRMSKRNASS